MKPVFADSYYFIAFLNPNDLGHERAVRWTASTSRPIVTTDFVLTEVADGMARLDRRRHFERYYRLVIKHPGIQIIPVSPELHKRGMKMYLDHMDKEWTLTDCTSFVVMRDMKLAEALTEDRHFEQAGMIPLLRPLD